MVKLSDLTAHEKFVLKLIGENPEEKHIGLNLRAANNLASYGLATYSGSMKFALTEHGTELYYERLAFFSSNPPEIITRSKSLPFIGDRSLLPVLASKTST